ncbi:MAG: bifunctional metallophosphatase/5'-nucleotidase [Candidatus Aminicenantes bacterium]|nr:bifunctional metallophosphatase/5'-nucleotidase [Candidatus Aminicenantes bacterium]
MKIIINGKTITLFSGATAGDAVRKHLSSCGRGASPGKVSGIRDRFGHVIAPDGELSEGDELIYEAKSGPKKKKKTRAAGAGRLLLFSFPFLCLLLSAASACFGRSQAPAETRIVFFHSNDIHGQIDNFGKIAAILDGERRSGAEVFYLCAGDNFTGNPVVDQADPPGEPILEIMNRLGPAALCLGNHEFDYGQDILERFLDRIQCPVITANMKAPAGRFSKVQPSVVLKTRTGVKIAVFGLLQVEAESGLPSTHPDKLEGLRFENPFETAAAMKRLRRGNDVLIGLTHLGYDQDRLLARAIPEVDAIIGGHSHTRVDPAALVDGVLIAQAGSDNRYLGRVDLTVRGGRVVEKSGRLIDLRGRRETDPEIEAMIARFNSDPALDRVLAETPFAIEGKDALGCLITDSWRAVYGLDAAFQNNGGIRRGRLGPNITVKDVYTVDPFENRVVEFVLTAAEIRSLVRNSFERGGRIDLQVSGLNYLVKADARGRVKDVILTSPDGGSFDEGRSFKVGVSSYIASAYAFEHRDAGRALGTTTAALIAFLERHPDLSVYRDIRRAESARVKIP